MSTRILDHVASLCCQINYHPFLCVVLMVNNFAAKEQNVSLIMPTTSCNNSNHSTAGSVGDCQLPEK